MAAVNDIVERLRMEDPHGIGGEAADEIERLRAIIDQPRSVNELITRAASALQNNEPL